MEQTLVSPAASGQTSRQAEKHAFENNKLHKRLCRQVGQAIGDFNMIDDTTGLIIERDNGEGVQNHACTDGKKPNCFHDLPKFKRIYKVEMNEANVNGPARKIGYVDLLNIADPHKIARKRLRMR